MTIQEIIQYLKNYKESYERLEKKHIEAYGDNYDDMSLHFIRDRIETYSDILNDILK